MSDELEMRLMDLINENSDLKMQLKSLRSDQYEKLKTASSELDTLRSANQRLTEELCEWCCLNCQARYYGPSAIERGNFKCLAPSCNGRYCVPSKYLVTGTVENTNIADEIKKIVSLKTAA